MSSPADPTVPADGLAALRGRRDRQRRQAPPPRHPRTDPLAAVPDAAPADDSVPVRLSGGSVEGPVTEFFPPTVVAAAGGVAVPEPATTPPAGDGQVDAPPPATTATPTRETAGEVSREIVPETAREDPHEKTGEPADGSPMPSLELDLTDPAMMLYSPTVMSIPSDIMARFETARKGAASHTGIVLDALREHGPRLPALVLARRPGPAPGDLFPLRGPVPAADKVSRPLPLRVRPVVGELRIMDGLADWVNDQVQQARPGAKRVTRSEMVAAALDASLPKDGRKRKT